MNNFTAIITHWVESRKPLEIKKDPKSVSIPSVIEGNHMIVARRTWVGQTQITFQKQNHIEKQDLCIGNDFEE